MLEHKESIDYVHIEMVLNQQDKNEVISGLFKGVLIKEGFTFILLQSKQDCTNLINLKFYNIMTIEVLREEYKDLTYLTTSKGDQEAGLGIINKLYDKLKDLHINDARNKEIIDVSKYNNVPDDKRNTDNTSEKTPIKRDFKSTNYNRQGSIYQGATSSFQAHDYYNNSAYKKKEAEPYVFKRSSTVPDKARLELMKEKLDQIAAGEFKPVLPEIKNDPAKEENSTENNVKEANLTNPYEEDYMYEC